MIVLNQELLFPSPELANEYGMLAIGGDLSVERLLLAYRSGIFPWFNEGDPIIWHSPDPRMVLFPDQLKVSKSMRQLIRREVFTVTVNKAFSTVIEACAKVARKEQEDTWITTEMQYSYEKLHQMGHAISVEVWQDSELVGGLYGIDLPDKKIFCGESMFSKVSNASKYGFIHWVQQLALKKYRLIDCQVYTDHLASLGAREIPRQQFMSFLQE